MKLLQPLMRALATFLIPESALSAKLIFDNVRNYVVIGVLFAVASWLRGGGLAAENPFFKPQFGGQSLLVHDWVLYSASALFLLNVLQSLELGHRFVVAAADVFGKLLEHLKEHPSTLVALGGTLLALVTVIAFLLAFVALSVLLLIVVMAVVAYGGYARAA